MADQRDGGPAFPFILDIGEGSTGYHQGMSLRDWFAGQALAAVFSWATDAERTADPENIARWAYRCADAMIVARQPGGLDL